MRKIVCSGRRTGIASSTNVALTTVAVCVLGSMTQYQTIDQTVDDRTADHRKSATHILN